MLGLSALIIRPEYTSTTAFITRNYLCLTLQGHGDLIFRKLTNIQTITK